MQLLENVKPESHHRLWSPKKIQGILDVVADFGTVQYIISILMNLGTKITKVRKKKI